MTERTKSAEEIKLDQILIHLAKMEGMTDLTVLEYMQDIDNLIEQYHTEKLATQ